MAEGDVCVAHVLSSTRARRRLRPESAGAFFFGDFLIDRSASFADIDVRPPFNLGDASPHRGRAPPHRGHAPLNLDDASRRSRKPPPRLGGADAASARRAQYL